MSRWPDGDPDLVVREVLRGRAYRGAAHESTAPSQPTFWAWLWQAFVEHVLRPIFAPLKHAFDAASSTGVGGLLAIGLVVFALGLFAFVAYRLALAFVRTRERTESLRDERRALARERRADAWRDLAREYAARGDFARAIAALFSAALALLDERAVVAFDASRTPGEYRRAVRRARASASEAFDRLAERFVYASYAREIATAQAYADADAAFDRFEPATRA